MKAITVAEIAQALGQTLPSDLLVDNICTDSREARAGSLFVAIPGERVDGHDYVVRAIEQGAALALVQRPGDYPAGRTVQVADTVRAMLHLAAWYRSQLHPHVVGITGSVGKTTTKDMIAAALSSQLRTVKTIGNQNNEIGAPRTVLSIDADTQAAVIEMGMSGPGEIRALAGMAQPEVGVITNVGVNHIEYLGSRENILHAKLELADSLPDGATLLLCADNDLLETVEIDRLHVVYYGLDSAKAQLRGVITGGDAAHTAFAVHWQGKVYYGEVPGTGRHLVQNALAAFGVSAALGLALQPALDALRGYQPSGMRQKTVQRNGITFVEDCYNASPDSVAAALRTLGDMETAGRRIAVLSDMLELGSIAAEAHRSCGTLAAEHKLDRLLLWGDHAADYAQGAREGGLQPDLFASREQLAPALATLLQPGDIVWFKASRGKQLEQAIEALYALLD